jgi:hypothetical protein
MVDDLLKPIHLNLGATVEKRAMVLDDHAGPVISGETAVDSD